MGAVVKPPRVESSHCALNAARCIVVCINVEDVLTLAEHTAV
jgi:hypothetical protein